MFKFNRIHETALDDRIHGICLKVLPVPSLPHASLGVLDQLHARRQLLNDTLVMNNGSV